MNMDLPRHIDNRATIMSSPPAEQEDNRVLTCTRKQLYSQTQNATGAQYDRAGNLIDDADAEIERFEEILRQIEELQTEFEKVRRIGEIVKHYRSRVEALDRRI